MNRSLLRVVLPAALVAITVGCHHATTPVATAAPAPSGARAGAPAGRGNAPAAQGGRGGGDPWAQLPDAQSIAANAKLPMPKLIAADRKNVEFLLRSLAHDSMEGRGLGTRGSERAAQFIAGQFKKAGIQPGGEAGQGYFQRVPMRMTIAVPGGRGGVVRMPTIASLDTVPAERRVFAKNVIAIIPGTDPVLKDQVIMVLAHYDHLGMRAGSAGPDSIYNGADDDASGTTAVMEIARHLKDSKPKRTILFAAMTGEERGMVGTNFYLTNPLVALKQVVAGFEIEMIGRADSLAGGPGKAWLTGYYRSTMGDVLKASGIAIVPDARPSERFFTRSDNYALARMGIVAHTLSTFNGHKDYHQVSDDADKIDFDHMTRVIASAVEAVKHLASGPLPTWHQCGNPSPDAPDAKLPECIAKNGAPAGGRGRGATQ